jgi:hypothetical protein
MRWEQMTVRPKIMPLTVLNIAMKTMKQFLDGRFRVRGVSSLRVVDMSSWPDAPGFFPTTRTYMVGSGHPESPDFHVLYQLSERAADLILQDTQPY